MIGTMFAIVIILANSFMSNGNWFLDWPYCRSEFLFFFILF